VDQSQRSALIALASANDRSLAAEIRRAIEAYLAHQVPAVK
jgi:hypothetical protein